MAQDADRITDATNKITNYGAKTTTPSGAALDAQEVKALAGIVGYWNDEKRRISNGSPYK